MITPAEDFRLGTAQDRRDIEPAYDWTACACTDGRHDPEAHVGWAQRDDAEEDRDYLIRENGRGHVAHRAEVWR